MKKIVLILLLMPLIFHSCKKEKHGSLQVNFEYYWGDEKLQLDGTEYNTFMIENDSIISGTDTVIVYDTVKRFIICIENFQFFLSEFSLDERDFFQPEINYFDIKNRNSITFDNIPCKNYPFISFRFGIAATKNISGIFVNPPERDMFFPENLGGGYHLMKLDGKWRNYGYDITENQGFNLHLGALTYNDPLFGTKKIEAGVYALCYDNQYIRIDKDETTNVNIKIDISQFFRDWDFSQYLHGIMDNADAMLKILNNMKRNRKLMELY